MLIPKPTLNLFLLALLLFALVSVTSGFTLAQDSTSQWSAYQRVPGYSNDTLPPFLIADQNNTVHAFVSQWVGQNNPSLAVVYREWSLSNGWSAPTDVLLSPDRQARLMGVFLDQSEKMHLIFFGGDQSGGDIYYSSAPAVNVGQVSAWSTPVSIGRNAVDPSSATLTGDHNRNLAVVYSGNLAGNGLYAVTSSDSGNTWSDPTPIFFTNSTQLWPFGIQLYMGDSGYIHAVWNVVDPQGHNIAGYYARYDFKSNEWSNPLNFDKSIGVDVGMGIANPIVIEYDGEVFIMYNNGIPPTGVPPSQWYVRSFDAGKTWTIPIRISQRHVGRNGISTFLVDSNNVLHLIFADRIPITTNGVYDAIGGIFHSVWSGTSWSEPQYIAAMTASQATAASQRNPNFPTFAPYNARAVISQGNAILTTWMTDPGFGHNGVWYSYSRINAPTVPPEPLPTNSSYPIPATGQYSTPGQPSPDQISPTQLAEANLNNTAYPGTPIVTNPAVPITESITLVVIALFVVVIWRLLQRR
jgi:hypothetical protein